MHVNVSHAAYNSVLIIYLPLVHVSKEAHASCHSSAFAQLYCTIVLLYIDSNMMVQYKGTAVLISLAPVRVGTAYSSVQRMDVLSLMNTI